LNRKAGILIIDDDAGIRKTLSKILEREGYVVKDVENGKQAIEASKEEFFNVALIDIRLPDIEGTKLLDKLKETEPKMVKIIVTGFPSLQNAIDAVNEGADGYILKPFDVKELLTMIENHLKKQEEDLKYTQERVTEYITARVKQLELEGMQHQRPESGSV
jgi:DNA-binding NtrC family response regulator